MEYFLILYLIAGMLFALLAHVKSELDLKNTWPVFLLFVAIWPILLAATVFMWFIARQDRK